MRSLVAREKNIQFFEKEILREMIGAENTFFLMQYDCETAADRRCSLAKVIAVATFISSGTVTEVVGPFNLSAAAGTCTLY
jgi:hypothetical protein